MPTAEETSRPSPFGGDWEDGKVFSCRCGGDARTDPYCQLQKDTTFLFHVTDGERKTFLGGDDAPRVHMHVKEYAGIPNQGEAALPWNYEYAFAPVWDANFTQCAWRVSSCLEPLPADEDCAIYECAAGEVACPPADLPKCPGRNAFGCGLGPDGHKKYWQHPCNPLVTPRDQGVTFWCSLNRTSADAYGGGEGRLCYWNQPGVIPSFAVTCVVGNCVYDGEASEGTGGDALRSACPAVFTPPEFWTGDRITRVCMASVAVALVAAAALYVRLESRSPYSVSAAAAFERVAGPRSGEPLAPAAHARTPSAVLGSRRARRGVRDLPDPLDPGEDSGDPAPVAEGEGLSSPTSAGGSAARLRPVVSWENVRVYATAVTAANPGGVVKKILRGVSGHAGPGPSESSVDAPENSRGRAGTRSASRGGSGVFAILGPSGAGKSTLLDFLAGRTPKGQAARGTVRVDGARVSAKEMRAISGYVPQDDVLPGTSTVWEHLLFHATLRLPEQTPREELYRCVVGWSNELGLGKVAESRIGDQFTRGLSGGEKRRVSIAAALLTSPSIMFLDEPTTGLDSTNAAKVVDILAALGETGVTVVLSIHQPRPDVFRLLDRVLVMSSTGRAVYCGASARAEAHFASLGYAPTRPEGVNVADYVLDVVLRASESEAERMTRDFDASAAAALDATARARIAAMHASSFENVSAPRLGTHARTFRASFGTQTRALWRRMAKNVRRHPFLLALHFFATACASAAIGFVFRHAGRDTGGIQNRMGALFFTLLYLTLMSLSSLPVWREDRLLFLREKAAGAYDTASYFVAVVVFDVLALRVLPPLFFALVAYPMIGLHGFSSSTASSTEAEGDASVFTLVRCVCTFALVLVLANVAASALCMSVGIVTPSNATANACGLLVLLVNLLCGGFFLNEQRDASGAAHRETGGFSSFSAVRLLSGASFVNRAFEALLINEFLGAGTFEFTPKFKNGQSGGARSSISVDVTGDEVLRFFKFGDSTAVLISDVSTLAGLAVGYVALAFALLKWTTRRMGVD